MKVNPFAYSLLLNKAGQFLMIIWLLVFHVPPSNTSIWKHIFMKSEVETFKKSVRFL